MIINNNFLQGTEEIVCAGQTTPPGPPEDQLSTVIKQEKKRTSTPFKIEFRDVHRTLYYGNSLEGFRRSKDKLCTISLTS